MRSGFSQVGLAFLLTLLAACGGGGTSVGGNNGTSVAPSTTAQPNSQVVTAGSPVTFTVAATGTAPLSYQWRKGGTSINGATASSFTIASTVTSDSGSYDVVVSNAAGTVTSAVATLTVNPASVPPGITTQPQSQAVTAGSPVTFSVAATGTAPLSYQWRKGGISINSAASSSYTIASTFTNDSGSYDVVISNPAGTLISSTATLTINASGVLDLTIPAAYITQSTQTQAFNVPLVTDRNGYLRVFLVADQANTAKPQVRVRIYDAANALAQTYTINAPRASVPLSVDESSLSNSWNVAIPSNYIQPSYKLLVDVDPTNAIPESHKTNNTWPASGAPQILDVRTLQPFRVTFWSVQTGDSRTGNVSSQLVSSFTSLLEKIWPINNVIDRVYGGAFTVTDVLSDATTWNSVLGKLNAKRIADGVSDRHYYGVVNPGYSGGIAGYSLVGAPTAIGWDKSAGFGDLFQYSGIFAHETGHNFGLSHAPCGDPANPDPSYPYPGAVVGAWGMDVSGPTLKDPAAVHDIMSYCTNVWVSDYNYKKVLSNREGGSAPIILSALTQGATTPGSLLLWGRLSNGIPVLEPVFHMAVEALPPNPGDQLLEGFDIKGRRLFGTSFALVDVGESPQDNSRHFGFSIPLSESDAALLAEIRWTEAGKMIAHRQSGASELRLQARAAVWEPSTQAMSDGHTRLFWDAAAHPMVMVRDKATGLVIGFGEGGDFQFNSEALELELHFSDGIQSHSKVVRRPNLDD